MLFGGYGKVKESFYAPRSLFGSVAVSIISILGRFLLVWRFLYGIKTQMVPNIKITSNIHIVRYHQNWNPRHRYSNDVYVEENYIRPNIGYYKTGSRGWRPCMLGKTRPIYGTIRACWRITSEWLFLKMHVYKRFWHGHLILKRVTDNDMHKYVLRRA